MRNLNGLSETAYNTAYTLRANALALGILPPSIVTSYMLETLYVMLYLTNNEMCEKRSGSGLEKKWIQNYISG